MGTKAIFLREGELLMPDVVKRLGYEYDTAVLKLLKKGHIQGEKRAGRWVFNEESLKTFRRRREGQVKGDPFLPRGAKPDNAQYVSKIKAVLRERDLSLAWFIEHMPFSDNMVHRVEYPIGHKNRRNPSLDYRKAASKLLRVPVRDLFDRVVPVKVGQEGD